MFSGQYFHVSVGSDLSASNAANGFNNSTTFLCFIAFVTFRNIVLTITYADDIRFYTAFDHKIDGAAELALSKLS